MKPALPYLSVIVPAHDASETLADALEALTRRDLPRECWELIVVDDASGGENALIAARYADAVVRLPGGRHGDAYARNRGFEVAAGECVVFLDPDCRVHPDALRRIAMLFANEPGIDVIVGTYDTESPTTGMMSHYRTLHHHYIHLQSAEADTFWSSFGAMRREVFQRAQMYDEWRFSRPQAVDIELGYRIRALGHRILVRNDIRVTQLRQWSIRSAIRSDLRDRSVPWMQILMRQRAHPEYKGIALRTIEKINTASAWIALTFSVVAMITLDARWLMSSAISMAPVLFVNRRLYVFFARQRGMVFAVRAMLLHWLYYIVLGVGMAVAWLTHILVGDPRPRPIIEAYSEVGLEMWPPVPSKRESLRHLASPADAAVAP